MARTAIRGGLISRIEWQVARLVDIREETATARTLVLEVADWSGHLPGQHVDVRLTAEDGYSTQRSYSIGSAPSDDRTIELTIQLLRNGEVSPFLVEALRVGDPIELRGPIGGWFVWQPTSMQPVLLVAGGSGVVPLMSMIRARREQGSGAPFRLLYSSRTPADVFYRDELARSDHDISIALLFTRTTPEASTRPAGRLSAADLPEPEGMGSRVYVCGPTGFVESTARLLVDKGYDEKEIRTERFGPSGN